MKFRPNLLVYIVATLIFFLFWFYWAFPYDALKSRIITQIENQSQGRYRIDVKEMDFSLLGSATFKDLKVHELVGGQEQLLLSTPKLKLGFSPFALLGGRTNDFSFYLKGSKGDLEGHYQKAGDDTDFAVQFDDFPISDLKFISNKANLGLQGELNGQVEMKLHPADPSRNEGKIDLQLVNFSMGELRFSLDPTSPEGSMEIRSIKLSGNEDSVIKGEIQKEDLQLSAVRLKGGAIDLRLDGKVTLRGVDPKEFRLAIQGGVKLLSPELVKDLQNLLFILEQQKTPDGTYPLAFTGRLGKPSIRIGKFTLPL